MAMGRRRDDAADAELPMHSGRLEVNEQLYIVYM